MGKLKMSFLSNIKNIFNKDNKDNKEQSNCVIQHTVDESDLDFVSILRQQYDNFVYSSLTTDQEYINVVSALVKRDDVQFVKYDDNKLVLKCKQYIFEFYVGRINDTLANKARTYLHQCTIERLNVELNYENLKNRFVWYNGKLPLEIMIDVYTRFEKPNKRPAVQFDVGSQIISDLKD